MTEDQSLADYMQGSDDFLKCLTICHDCTQLKISQKDGSDITVLSGASLDEQCLLNQVQKDGIASFKSRTAKSVHIQIGGKDSSNTFDYDILAVIEFTSERKIMSVVVKEKKTGQHYCYVKGAESQIMANLCPESAQSALKEKIEAEVYRFGG